MYNRILVPTDGSELSDKALEAAADFAKALGSSIVIITVIEPYSYTNLSEYRPESIDQYDSRVKEMAQERLEIARELRFDFHGLSRQTGLRRGAFRQ